MRQSVVFPAPLGPTRPMRSPRTTRHEQSRRSAWPPYPLAIDSSEITCGARSSLASAHDLDALGRDLVDHAHLARLAVLVLVHPGVLLGERVDVGVRARFGRLRDAAADLEVAVGIVGIHDRERHLRRAPHVLVL